MPVADNHILQSQIDLISVPVFIADECDDDQFRMAAINSALARLAGIDKASVQGRTPHELVDDAATADQIVKNYRSCVETEAPISCRETIAFGGAPIKFDTTLQKISYANTGRYRIVGTALKIEDRQCVGSDIEFYVSMARNSLTTIEMLMDASAENTLVTMSEREATLILARKALLSLDDIGAAATRIVKSDQPADTVMSDAMRDLLLH